MEDIDRADWRRDFLGGKAIGDGLVVDQTVLIFVHVVDALRVWIREVRGPRLSPVLGRVEG